MTPYSRLQNLQLLFLYTMRDKSLTDRQTTERRSGIQTKRLMDI